MDKAERTVLILAFWAALPLGAHAIRDSSSPRPRSTMQTARVAIAAPLARPERLGAGAELLTGRLGGGGGFSNLPGGLVVGSHVGGGPWGPSVGASLWVDSGTWAGDGNLVFADGFERGDTSAWSAP